jgi:integral membrane protein (TIGR01906 family)
MLFKWLVAILVPFTLIMLGVRLLLTPLFLQIEYRLPGFPPDEYGFSSVERLRWGTYGIDYLLNDSPASYLGGLKFDSGQPVFVAREVSHMQDVKVVVGGLLQAWYGVLVLLTVLALWARKAGWLNPFREGLQLGGVLTLAVAGVSALLGTMGASGSGALFWEFFSGFHGIFFSGSSWLFEYSDTLIRLYPLRFWQDAVLYVGLLAAIAAGFLAFGLRGRPVKPSASG